MMKEMGAEGVQVEELYTLDMPEFEAVAPIFGLIFLYKWRPDEMRDGLPLPDPAPVNPHPEQLHSIFFANQVINAAAVTQALVTVLMNIHVPEVTLGPKLSEFKSYCTHLDPGLSGLAIHNASFIRDAHLKVSRPPPSPAADGLGPPPRPGEVDEDVYHFITWVPVATPSGTLAVYELDSLQDAPLYLGEVPSAAAAPPPPPLPVPTGDAEADAEAEARAMAAAAAVRPPGTAWLGPAAARLRAYVEVYSVAEVRHLVLGVVAHRVAALLADLRAIRMRETEGTAREGDEEREADILHRLAVEEDRSTGWAAESARRRHDYMPFLVETLKLLASKGELTALIDAAREQKRAAAKAAAKAAKAARGGKAKASKGGGGGEDAAGGSRG
ncbi:hypothetical protein MMPV_010171 [Pyropia vietnamensis]